MPTHIIRPDVMEPFEIGAFIVTLLAYPGANETQAQAVAARALSTLAVRAQCSQSPESEPGWRRARPEYFTLDDKAIRRALRQLRRRLRDRMIAARMSLGYFEEGITGRPPALPPEMARLSLNELSKLVLPQSGESNPDNLEKRAWRASLPVCHIAAALQVLMRASADSPEIDAIGYPLCDGDLHRSVIEFAQFHEDMVLKDPRFGVKAENLIRLRLAE